MRFIPTRLHGFADYAVGALVIALPFYFGWLGPGRIAFIAIGAVVIVYSGLTDYELGLVRYLRIRFHPLLDAIFGVAMVALPLVWGIPDDHRPLIYTIGIAALLLAATMKTRAEGTHPI